VVRVADLVGEEQRSRTSRSPSARTAARYSLLRITKLAMAALFEFAMASRSSA
jgi:hypothetical protein